VLLEFFCFMSQVRHVTSHKVISVCGYHNVLSTFVQGFSPLFTALLRGYRVRHQAMFGFSLMRKLTPTTQSNRRFHPCLKNVISKTTSLHTMVAAESSVLQHWHTFHTDVTKSVTHNEDEQWFLKFPSRFQPLKTCGMFFETFWFKFPWASHSDLGNVMTVALVICCSYHLDWIFCGVYWCIVPVKICLTLFFFSKFSKNSS
jgi:hypothetical protein